MKELIIIGSGPGGYRTAAYAARKGLHVTIFEDKEAGGTCLNCGCIPTKTLCHEAEIVDILKDKSTGVTTMDVAKRLLDYGYHAPTIYFPLLFHESLMIEPTENESKETIDGFIQVMRKIAQEAKENPELVKSAPHNTPIGRVDDVLAAKHPVVTFRQIKNEEQA